MNFSAFKRRKLDKVGNRTTFDTDRNKYENELEAGGMSAGFSDISGTQQMYNVTLTCNTAPHYLLGSEVHKIDTTVTKSYDDRFRCLTCTGSRKLHNILEKRRDLFLSISDQHFPAIVPPQDGNCMVTVRMSNMSLMDLGTHTVVPCHCASTGWELHGNSKDV